MSQITFARSFTTMGSVAIGLGGMQRLCLHTRSLFPSGMLRLQGTLRRGYFWWLLSTIWPNPFMLLTEMMKQKLLQLKLWKWTMGLYWTYALMHPTSNYVLCVRESLPSLLSHPKYHMVGRETRSSNCSKGKGIVHTERSVSFVHSRLTLHALPSEFFHFLRSCSVHMQVLSFQTLLPLRLDIYPRSL